MILDDENILIENTNNISNNPFYLLLNILETQHTLDCHDAEYIVRNMLIKSNIKFDELDFYNNEIKVKNNGVEIIRLYGVWINSYENYESTTNSFDLCLRIWKIYNSNSKLDSACRMLKSYFKDAYNLTLYEDHIGWWEFINYDL